MKAVEEEITKGVYYFGTEKTSHRRFFLGKQVKSTNEWPEVSHLVTKSNTRVPGDIPIMEIVYKYKYWKFFFATEGTGSTNPGDPYFLVSTTINIICLFDVIFVFMKLVGISMTAMKQTTKIGCDSLKQLQRNIG